jgi:Protein of unknown function (DUF2892)
MKKNMGAFDRVLRITAAVVVLVFYYNNVISGTVAIVLLAIAAIFILTSFIGLCPLYSLLGIRTRNTMAK